MEVDVEKAKASSDVAMETDAADGEKHAVTKGATAAKAKGSPAPNVAAVSSGLPHSKEELESLISTIHSAVNGSVLPRLQKCLTAKVRP